jgi:hypothetical protein
MSVNGAGSMRAALLAALAYFLGGQAEVSPASARTSMPLEPVDQEALRRAYMTTRRPGGDCAHFGNSAYRRQLSAKNRKRAAKLAGMQAR